MAKKAALQTFPKPLLVVPIRNATAQIEERIVKGNGIRNRKITSHDELDQAKKDRKKWSDYNAELLRNIFSNPSIAEEYLQFPTKAYLVTSNVEYLANVFIEDIDIYIVKLESILERLEFYEESAPESFLVKSQEISEGSEIFLVHGHDQSARETIARFVEHLGLKVTVLHEKPNIGRTIIEKFEAYAGVAFAIILLTPDDTCYSGDVSSTSVKRARQNVIFEMGYFIGKLGRDRVCVLHKEDVEILSDYQGVLYVPMDLHDGWKLKLAKEIKAAGIEVDLNRAV